VDLTTEIHKGLEKYSISGAQHGTSGNSSERLREIASKTHTTKANVATALQMVSWGLKVNDYGNAILDENENFIKVEGEGVDDDVWKEVRAFADEKGWKKGDYKRVNLQFENKFCGQKAEIKDRMVKRVEDFVYNMLINVFNAGDTASLAVDAILNAKSYDLGAKAVRTQDPAEWTDEKIIKKASELNTDKGEKGNVDD